MDANTVKVICATNPRDVLSPLAIQAAPEKGWIRLNAETDHEWISREGWKVVRLDGADCENVVQKKLVFPGLLTFEGYENLRLKAGGNSAEYWSFGRGVYPTDTSANTVIPLSFLDDLFGQLIFSGRAIPCGGVDLAFEGSDLVVFAAGRYGLCSGFRAAGSAAVTAFEKGLYAFQLDQLYVLPKQKTLQQAAQIKQLAQELGITQDWLALDRTGIGSGTFDALANEWPLVHGCNWGEAATDIKILEDDSCVASEEMADLPTEYYMALRKWIEIGIFKIAPACDSDLLIKAITQRRYHLASKGPTGLARVQIDSKREFKRQFGWSPDHADAAVMALDVGRRNGPQKARLTVPRPRPVTPKLGIVEKTKFVAFSDLDR
jgi:hypothetical protein